MEARDFQRKLNREADGQFVKKLEAKGMKVHEPTKDDVAAWQSATAPLWEDAKKIAGESWVAEPSRSAKDWDAGKFKAEEKKYVETYGKIVVPVDAVMASFK